MKYLFFVNWLIVHPNGNEPMRQTFPIRDSAVHFLLKAEQDSKSGKQDGPLGQGTFICCSLDSAKISQ